MSIGFARLASRGTSAASAARVSSLGGGSSSPAASQASAQRIPSPPPFVSTATRGPSGSGWRESRTATSESSWSVSASDHAGLAEHGLDRGRRAGQGGGVRAGGALACARAAALHREDRLLAGDPPRDAPELARVAERLEVEKDEIGVRVVLPVLEQVVRGDVRLVADRDERREAETARRRLLEQREPERSALRGEADVARREVVRREGRVQPRPGGEDPEAVRADQPGAVRAHPASSCSWRRMPSMPVSAKPGGDHAEGARPLRHRRLGLGEDRVAGDAEHGQVDDVGDVGDRGVGLHAGDRRAPSG